MRSNSLPLPQKLHDVLALILALGNVMNSGSKVRGQADGFHLNLLPQLMDVKATQATPTSAHAPSTVTTLLQFIVSYFVKYKVSWPVIQTLIIISVHCACPMQ
jgi:hypothetical protein